MTSRALLVLCLALLILHRPAVSDAAAPDILGLQIGMTPDEVEAKLREIDEAMEISRRQATLRMDEATPFVAGVVGKLGGHRDGEVIEVRFPPPPNPLKATMIARVQSFEDGNSLSYQTLRSALEEKYGSPIFDKGPERMDSVRMVWGSGTKPDKLIYECTSHKKPSYAGAAFEFPKTAKQECGTIVMAELSRDYRNKDLVFSVVTMIVDHPAEVASKQASSDFVAKKKSEADAARSKDAAERKPRL